MLIQKVKFVFSKKATKIAEIFTAIWQYEVSVKSMMVKIDSNFVAFLENTNFTYITPLCQTKLTMEVLQCRRDIFVPYYSLLLIEKTRH